MEFINYVSHSSFFVPGAVARKLWLLAVCALLAAAGLARFSSRPVQAKQGTPFQGESAVQRPKTDGDYASLAQALLAGGARAPYPPTIDALLAQRQKLTAVDGAASNYFGTAGAVSGNTLVIRAANNQGREGDGRAGCVFSRHA